MTRASVITIWGAGIVLTALLVVVSSELKKNPRTRQIGRQTNINHARRQMLQSAHNGESERACVCESEREQ